MARYIDADKADVRSIHSSYMGYSSWADVLEWLQTQPTADVVEVVRCKDCKYRKKDKLFLGYCCYLRPVNGGKFCGDDDFCSYGERKTENAL